MELQHPRPPEPPVKVPPNEDIPDPLDDPTRGTPDYLPPDSPPVPERDPAPRQNDGNRRSKSRASRQHRAGGSMEPEVNPTEARQAKPVGHMRYVLAISFGLAALALLIVYLFVS